MTACVHRGLIFTFQEPLNVQDKCDGVDQKTLEDTSILVLGEFTLPLRLRNEAVAEWMRSHRTAKVFVSPPHGGQTQTLFSLLLCVDRHLVTSSWKL